MADTIFTQLSSVIFGTAQTGYAELILYTLVLILVMSIWDGIIDIIVTLIKKV